MHLADFASGEGEAQAPSQITQGGLARGVGIQQRHVPQYVRPLLAQGLVVERIAHIQGARQRKKAYFLTPEGRHEAGRLRGNLLGTMVEVEIEGGRRSMRLGEAVKGPFKGIPLLDLLRFIEARGFMSAPRGIGASEPSGQVREPAWAVPLVHRAPLGPPLVDRLQEMQQLHRALLELKEGQGGCLMITGEAGIGKSRLALELSSMAAEEGVLFVTGQATEYGGASLLAPWTEALRGLVIATPPSLLRNFLGPHSPILSRIIPDLPARLGLGVHGSPGPAELDRFQLFDAVTQFLINASKVGPIILFLDDLQWADEATTQLLSYVNRNAASERILLLASYRPEDVVRDGPLEVSLYDLRRTRRLEQIHLERLGHDDVQALIGEVLEAERLDPKLTSAVFDRARGNPFFTEELTLSLREEDRVYVRDGEAVWSDGAVRLPSSVQLLIRRRLARLSRPAREMLLAATTMGQRVRPDVLAKVSGLEWDALVDLVDEALGSGLLTEGIEGDLLFSDELVRECLYETISQMRRRRYHHRAAEVLAALPSPSVEDIAYHYAQAGLAEQARKYLEAAGDEALALAAFQRAAERFERALSFWPMGHDEVRRRLFMKLGDAYFQVGKYVQARDAYLRARGLLHTPQEDAAIAVRLAEALFFLWDIAALRTELDRALAILGDTEDLDAAKALNMLALTLMEIDGDNHGSIRVAERALTIATKLGSRQEQANALDTLAAAKGGAWPWEDAGAYMSQLLDMLDAGVGHYEDPERWVNAAVFYTELLPDYPRALECGRRGVEIAKRNGNYGAEASVRRFRVLTLTRMGRWEDAENEVGIALPLAKESFRGLAPIIGLFQAEIAGLRGDLKGGEYKLLEALNAREFYQRVHYSARANTYLAWVRAEAGDLDGARQAMRRAFEIIQDHRGCGWCAGPAWVAAAAIETMEAGGDEARFEEAIRQVQRGGSPIAKASTPAVEARWRRLHGAPSEEGLEATEAYWRRIGNPFELASALHEHALTSNALGRALEAKALLEEALGIFRELGANKRVKDVLRSGEMLGT